MASNSQTEVITAIADNLTQKGHQMKQVTQLIFLLCKHILHHVECKRLIMHVCKHVVFLIEHDNRD